MKLSYDDQKKLGIFLILIIFNSFSHIKCNPIDLLDLDKLDKLVDIRKESSNSMKKEYDEFKTKFAPKLRKIQESLKNPEIYFNLKIEIKNIKKTFLDYFTSKVDSKY
jgi:hypothetical protein